MIYLIDLVGKHRSSGILRTFRFAEGLGYNTQPNDDPANVHYQPRINQPGRYKRTLFSSGGKTSGVASVDRGEITLNNMDRGLDEMFDYAFDGYDLTLYSLADSRAPYSSRNVITRATVQTIQVLYDEVRLELRSLLALLDKPIQNEVYKGTTLNGSVIEAEGEANLKDVPRPLLFGTRLNITPILVNRFYNVFDVGQRFSVLHEVRDKGGLLTAFIDYATLALLIGANIPEGYYGTCKAEGVFRVGGNVSQSTITCKASEGDAEADRYAGAIVKRILTQQYGMVAGVDYSASDLAALDSAAPFNLGAWTGTAKPEGLSVVSALLDAVGASICPDRSGMIRFARFNGVASAAIKRFSQIEVGSEITRLPTGDNNSGIPAKKTILYYGQNDSVTTKESLTGNTQQNDPAFVDFATKEWRQLEAKNDAVTNIHKLAEDIEFESAINNQNDAQQELTRRNNLYNVVRDSYQVPISSYLADSLDMGDVVTLEINRFGLQAGKDFVIIGIEEDHEERATTLEVWG